MKKRKKSNNQQLNINQSVEIDYDKLAKCITSAIIESKNEEEKIIEQNEDELDKNWKKTIGLKEHEQNEKLLKRLGVDISNDLHILKIFIFFKKDYAKNTQMTFGIMAIILSIIFRCLWLLFGLLSVSTIGLILTAKISAWYLLFFLYTLFFAQLMHIISLEIEQMEDENMINMIFSSLMAFIAALFTVISFVYSISH